MYIYDLLTLIDIYFYFLTLSNASHFIYFGPIMKVGILGTQNAKLGFRARFRERFGPTTWPSELGILGFREFSPEFSQISPYIRLKWQNSYGKTMKRCDLGTICGVKQW